MTLTQKYDSFSSYSTNEQVHLPQYHKETATYYSPFTGMTIHPFHRDIIGQTQVLLIMACSFYIIYQTLTVDH